MRFLLPLVLSTACSLPAIAADFRAINRLNVVPISADTFEVIEDHGAGASDIWCAASEYARAAGLDGVRRRMYVVDPRGPSKTRANEIGVVFTVNPDDEMRNSPTSYSVTVKRRGENLSIGHANEFCRNLLEDAFGQF